jgi:hypothetical protein
MNDDLMNILNLKKLIPVEKIYSINTLLQQSIRNLKLDLAIDDELDFNFLMQKESLASRFLGYRFINTDVMSPIVDAVSNWLSANKIPGKWYFSPLIYPRICRPDYAVIKNNALLYTEPHYDKIDGLNPFWGVWVPLEEVNEDSGGLCYFDMPSEIREAHFPASRKNFTLKSYITEHKEVDRIVAPYLRVISAMPGDVILFNEKCLHGATKPISKNRISINFQMIHESTLSKLSEFEQLKIIYSNAYLDELNLINLFNLGDIKFVKNNLEILNKQVIHEEILNQQRKKIHLNAIDAIEKMPSYEELKMVFPWNKEFLWLKESLEVNSR